jgi:hypothetical protein
MNLAATLNPFGLLCGRQSLPNCAGRFWHHLHQREEVLEKVLMLPRVGTHELDWLGFLLLASLRFSTNLQEHFLRWALPYLTCLLCLHIMLRMLWHVLVMTALMTTLVVMLPSKYCCRDFSATLIDMLWHANCNVASFCNYNYPPVDGPWSSVRLALLLIPLFLFFCFCLFLSFLVWNFLWLLEEVLTLLWFFLYWENRDLSIFMKDITITHHKLLSKSRGRYYSCAGS